MIRWRLSYIVPLAALALAGASIATPASAATSGTWTATGSMSTARFLDTATVLPNGEVLAAGGESGSTALASAELYNPATGKWAPTGSMSSAREGHAATLLPDGDVLVTAGIEANGPFAEFYTPATGTWSAATGGLAACTTASDCRYDSRATLLGDGNVLVAGGLTGTASNPGSTVSAILYNPATNSWTATGSLAAARDDQTATALKNGQVLIAGGGDFVKHALAELASANLYTP
jgi:hypothetical protein